MCYLYILGQNSSAYNVCYQNLFDILENAISFLVIKERYRFRKI
jgi:hypothetical protein